MRIEETRWKPGAGWQSGAGKNASIGRADLVIYFGNQAGLRSGERFAELRAAYGNATIVGCSGTRSISGDVLEEDGIVAVALGFDRTPIRLAHHYLADKAASRAAGEAIGGTLAAPDLAGIFVLADGLRVAGSELIAGLASAVGSRPIIVGGMASDSLDFSEAIVGADCPPRSGMVSAVGFYGDAIRLTHGCASGFDAFGPRRRITRSSGNVLFELDGRPPYELYQRYLGEEIAGGISEKGVTYPLIISPPEYPDRTLVRAPMSRDSAADSMTFAGHMPEGWIARLMRGNPDRLILGSADAARQARVDHAANPGTESLALMVSCVGRQQMLGQRTEEELEAAGVELGSNTTRIGFYSYGEIAPMAHSGVSEVHNETMTITTLFEAGS
jgi:hypothetical protein